MGVNVDWPSRLNDAGYHVPWRAWQAPEDKAIYLLEVANKTWKRLSQGQPSPQNLYEQTTLAFDSKRDQVILHGAGKNRDELWLFEMLTQRWKKMQPKVRAPKDAAPPVSAREGVYLPSEDVFLIYGPSPQDRSRSAVWIYKLDEDAWYRVNIPSGNEMESPRNPRQDRAMVYDPKNDLVLLVVGSGGDDGKASVYALRYRHERAQFVDAR